MAWPNRQRPLYLLWDSRRGRQPGTNMVQGMNLTDICILILVFQGFSPAKVIVANFVVLLAVRIPTLFIRTSHHNTDKPQAARDICSSQETLIDLFECIEIFSRRLEIYTEVPQYLGRPGRRP
jgi:hypothetical protein